jgi:hypothetical protein
MPLAAVKRNAGSAPISPPFKARSARTGDRRREVHHIVDQSGCTSTRSRRIPLGLQRENRCSSRSSSRGVLERGQRQAREGEVSTSSRQDRAGDRRGHSGGGGALGAVRGMDPPLIEAQVSVLQTLSDRVGRRVAVLGILLGLGSRCSCRAPDRGADAGRPISA